VKILIVEDREEKCKQILDFLRTEFGLSDVQVRHSYNTGLAAIKADPPDLILLDMSMTTFDRTRSQSGGRSRPYAGRDILHEIKRKRMPTRAVVVTQFETFAEGTPQKTTLNELRKELEVDFPEHYLGTVFYRVASNEWRRQLKRFLRTAGLRPSGKL
jgi:CheY-like chemotaxis protein